ncbi:MAG: Cobalt-zinc-cadmium resistance protein CzcA [Planctomycetes bacterium ADurb.Bin126]|nr:MAG: Cobalt-zinc-cadmium resistance protein CzcA [Planctomycetes bacterium ADurb.Bin126]HOD84018.1 CusA/CzcA family heavy metal efflux RND transporter [Phycisphaerae bacterium]
MLDPILRFVLKQKLLMLMAGVVLVGAGVLAWQKLPIDAFPDVTNVQVMILTEAPGLAPGEVERLVTFPIEVEMGGLPQVKQVRSSSKAGLSQVIVVFDDDADTYFTRQVVFERLAAAKDKLPPGIEPEMGPISTGLGEIYQYALEAGYYCPRHPSVWSRTPGACSDDGQALVKSDYDLIGLRTLQDWLVTPQLRRLEGVNEVNSFGGFVKQFHVVPRPELLLKYKITAQEILDALEKNNANASGGYLVQDWEQMNVVSKGLIRTLSDIEGIVLKADDGSPVYLRDVAEVKIGRQTRNGVVTKDGRGEAVLGMAIMLKGSNSKDVVDRVKATIPGIQKSLPAGVKIVPFYDRTDLIQACIDTVAGALGQGVIFVVIILFLILWDFRAALTVAFSIPLTAAAAFLLMGWQGVTANLMSLGGLAIALGMIVDASIVVTENIARHMREMGDSPLSRTEIALEALREVARPVVFSILIIIIVFLPLFALESMEGKMFKPLALTMCFALLGSLAASLTVVPALASLVVKRGVGVQRENPLVRLFQCLHAPVLRIALKGRWIALVLVVALMVAGFMLLSRVGTEFLPALDEGALAINVVRLPTASVEGSAIQCTEIEKRLLAKYPEVISVVSKTGRAEISEDPMGPEQSDLLIMLKPKSQWSAGLTREELVSGIDKELAAIPGLRPAFSQPIALRVNELISGIKSDLAIKVIGEDLGRLREIAESVAPVLASIEGAEDVKIEQISGLSQLEIQQDRQAMARHKINAEDINALVEIAVGGKVATTAYEGQRRFDVLVRFPEDTRNSPERIGSLLIHAPAGYNVPLSDLASIKQVDVPAQISREDSMPRVIIECNIRGRDTGSFVEEAGRKLASIENSMPAGYRLALGGQFENQQRAMGKLKILVPVAVFLIFLMLFTSLNSVKSAILILANLPFAVIGGIAAIWLLDINLSVSASIGFIALLGVAVENGLLLVSFMDQLRSEGASARDAVAQACHLRIRPLVMTTATTLLGLLPLVYATGSGSELQKPLVAVIFGGLVSSLALTLIILPVLYTMINRTSPQPGPAATAG